MLKSRWSLPSPHLFFVRMSGPFNAVGISILSYSSPNIFFFFILEMCPQKKNILKKSYFLFDWREILYIRSGSAFFFLERE